MKISNNSFSYILYLNNFDQILIGYKLRKNEYFLEIMHILQSNYAAKLNQIRTYSFIKNLIKSISNSIFMH